MENETTKSQNMPIPSVVTETANCIVEVQMFDNIKNFLKLSLLEKTNVIKLGLQLYEQGKQIQLSEQNTHWETEINNINERHSQTLSHLRTQCDELKQNIRTMKAEYSAEKERLSSTIMENAHITFKSQIDNLRERNDLLQTKLSNIENENRQITQKQIADQREFYENKLQRQTNDFEALRSSYEERINVAIGRNQNSTIKGKDSEEEVFTMLNKMFPTAIIEDTHTIPGRGDFILRFDNLVMMVETKNYTRNVQKSEVDKFYRDMESPSNSDIQCGILISMNCGICAHDDFTLEVRSGKPLMFLHNIRDNKVHIRLAAQMFKLILSQNSFDLTSAELRGKLTQLAKNIKTNDQKHKTHLDKYYQQSLGMIEDQQSNIREMYSTLCVKF